MCASMYSITAEHVAYLGDSVRVRLTCPDCGETWHPIVSADEVALFDRYTFDGSVLLGGVGAAKRIRRVIAR